MARRLASFFGFASDATNSNSTAVEESFPNEQEASSRVAVETNQTLLQLESALAEVEDFNLRNVDSSNRDSSMKGFVLLESNLIGLLQKVKALKRWHLEKHANAEIDTSHDKKLLLAEISILLVTPYIHRLLTTEDRLPSDLGGLFDNNDQDDDDKLSPERLKLKQMTFSHIDPVYSTRYDGISLAALLNSVKNDHSSLFWCCSTRRCGRKAGSGSQLSFALQAHSQVLASKFFGAITCLEMILLLGSHQEEEDLILERAVGHTSRLEVPGVVEELLLYEREDAKRNLNSFTTLILTANAVVDSGYNKPFLLQRLACYAFAGMRLVLPWNRAEAELRGELCYSGTKEEITKKLHFARFVWNLPETALVKNFYRMGLERIRVDYEFYIPPSTLDGEAGGLDPIFARVISNKNLKVYPSTTTIAKAKAWRRPNDVFSPSRPLHTPLLTNKDANDVLLVHFHGGGFIALSSFSHENYTRIWAKDVPGVTVLSSDYRLAPDYKFPYAFNDAYRTYRFAVENCETQFGFVPRKVLLAGDSAGGNLCCSVAVQAIKDGYRVPDGLLLVYPVVDMRRIFSPALMWSVNDRIVPFVFLECCMSAYLGDTSQAKETAEDTRCSPALASDDVLRRMPPTRIVVGDNDPLMDQSVRFANHLARLNVDVKCKIFQAMPHGFCSFIWPVVGVPEVRKCVDECSVLLRELAEMPDASSRSLV